MNKDGFRKHLRRIRREHVASLSSSTRALILHRPPAPVLNLVPENAAIGLYDATPDEAPATGYAKFFRERGHRLALPRFAGRDSAMEFAAWADPWSDDELVPGPFGLQEPAPDAEAIVPAVLFVPLVGFTSEGIRLGQGGGHYDRWLAKYPGTIAIGLAWDAQLVDDLPQEPHDRSLDAVVTPTRVYGPFA